MRILLILALCAITMASVAQTGTKPPPEVRKNFILKYPDAAIQNWDLVEETYQANYKRQGKQYYSLYNPKGEWIQTNSVIDPVTVPLTVREAIRNSNYSTWPVDNVTKIEFPNNTYQYRYNFTRDGKTQVLTVDELGGVVK